MKIVKAKEQLSVKDDVGLNLNSLMVLESRYLNRDSEGNLCETPGQLFRRVAENISKAELIYGKSQEQKEKICSIFYKMMTDLEFLPNSPTLMNAGLEIQQLAACFVLPIEDSMEGIFETLKNTALIHKSGGGTGFAFSRIRPRGDMVQSTKGIASGPVSFMKIYDAATEQVKQGGKRRGANMGILRVDHPDILEFISAKENPGVLNNFNISIGLTENFMNALENDRDYRLINPRNGETVKKIRAKSVFDLAVNMAWKNGEPGIIFLDRINEDNPTPKLGEIEATNPCAEQPLLPYEACTLGSVNLSRMVKKGEVDWHKLKNTVHKAVHFLDNALDMSRFPMEEIKNMVHGNRKIGLGVMGFADFLIQLRIPYNSEEGENMGEKIMNFIHENAVEQSEKLADERGAFPNFKKSSFYNNGRHQRRNSTLTTVAPTGTISIIAGASSGIEPLFAVSYLRHTDQFEFREVNPLFEKAAREKGFYSEELIRRITKGESIQDIKEIPSDIKKLFVTSGEISPEWHVRVQAAFQKYTDNAVSKTINFRPEASPEEVKEAFLLADKLKCKGLTVYRSKSRGEQVLNHEENKITRENYQGKCPSCS
jgi:ribonucleoside-diphosphate reductase alpha chain